MSQLTRILTTFTFKQLYTAYTLGLSLSLIYERFWIKPNISMSQMHNKIGKI